MDIIFLKEFTKELIRNSRPPELNFMDFSPMPQIVQKKAFSYDKPENFKIFFQKQVRRYPQRQMFEERVQQNPRENFQQNTNQAKQQAASEMPEGMHESIMTRDISQKQQMQPQQPPLSLPPTQKQTMLRQIQARSIHPQIQARPTQQMQRQQPMQARIETAKKPISKEQAEIDLFQLNAILRDPKVTKIECQGPGKVLLVSSFGLTSQASLKLTEEEIQAIIKAFSEATRIPLVGGTFKAIYKNLLMTAIICDYGSRFILERKYLS